MSLNMWLILFLKSKLTDALPMLLAISVAIMVTTGVR